MVNRAGNGKVSGDKNLKGSQSYPEEFGHAMASLVQQHHECGQPGKAAAVAGMPARGEVSQDITAIVAFCAQGSDKREDEKWQDARSLEAAMGWHCKLVSHMRHPWRGENPVGKGPARAVQRRSAPLRPPPPDRQAELDSVLRYILRSKRIRAPFELDMSKLLVPFGLQMEMEAPHTHLSNARHTSCG